MKKQPFKASKTERVLRILQQVGELGIHSFDLVPYGGYRYSARIKNLRDQGFNIVAVSERKGGSTGVRYTLLG